MLRGDNYELGRRPALDGLRAIAVIAVIVGHTFVGGSAGTIGVTLFFALSGFLITRLLLEEHRAHERIDLRAFYLRRVRRLSPALAVFLIGQALFFVGAGGSLAPIFASALQLANFTAASGMKMVTVGHTWSLSFEEQFYLLWPPVLIVLTRWRRKALVPVLSGSILLASASRFWLALSGASYERVSFGADSRADALLIGCLLAVAVPTVRHVHGALAAAGACSMLALSTMPDAEASAWMLAPVAVTATVVVAWAATTTSSGSAVCLLSSKPLRALGRISYGVYLWHNPIAMFTLLLLPQWAALLVTLTLAIPIAMASWRYVEQPILRRNRGQALEPASDRVAAAAV